MSDSKGDDATGLFGPHPALANADAQVRFAERLRDGLTKDIQATCQHWLVAQASHEHADDTYRAAVRVCERCGIRDDAQLTTFRLLPDAPNRRVYSATRTVAIAMWRIARQTVSTDADSADATRASTAGLACST